jgi:hypothetical protein
VALLEEVRKLFILKIWRENFGDEKSQSTTLQGFWEIVGSPVPQTLAWHFSEKYENLTLSVCVQRLVTSCYTATFAFLQIPCAILAMIGKYHRGKVTV